MAKSFTKKPSAFLRSDAERILSGINRVDRMPETTRGDSQPRRNAYESATVSVFYNGGGTDCPAFGVMRWQGDELIQGRVRYTTYPVGASDPGPVLINTGYPIKSYSNGAAQVGPIFKVLFDGTQVGAGQLIGPKLDTFKCDKYGRLFEVISYHAEGPGVPATYCMVRYSHVSGAGRHLQILRVQFQPCC